MGVLFNILTNSIGSLFWGALIAIVVTGVVWFVCQLLNRGRPPLAYIVLAVLFILTWTQATMMVGAMKAKGYVEDIGDYANSLVSTGSEVVESATNFEELRQQLSDQFRIFLRIEQGHVSDAAQYVSKGHTLVDFVADNLNDTLNYYILRRVLWLIGFVVVAMVVVILTNGKRKNNTYGVQDFDEISSIPMEFGNYEL